MKQKLFYKMLLSFITVLLLFTVVIGFVFLSLFRNHTIQMHRSAMKKNAQSIAQTLSDYENQTERMGGYGAYLRSLDELTMAEVWIVDENLQIMTKGQRQTKMTEQTLPEYAKEIVERVFTGEVTYGEGFSQAHETYTITVGAPIYNHQQVIGAVLLHAPIQGVNEAVFQGFLVLVMGMVIGLCMAGTAAGIFSYRLSKPMLQMKNTALAIANGDYTVKTGIGREDELGQLAKALDEMASRLKKAQEERNALDHMRDSFVTNVSHELRTPVAVLRGSLENLVDGAVCTPEDRKETYAQMLSESCHLERLVNDLLELNRLQDEGFSLQLQPVNLCDIVRDATRSIRRYAKSKDIDVAVSLPEEECVILGDYGRLRQLILILLDNAVKFSEEHEEILVQLEEKKGYTLSVTDHGSEIAPEDLPYIFERFHKKNSVENKNGTGLGLAIAKEIVNRHHASIQVQSDSNATCFTVAFAKHS